MLSNKLVVIHNHEVPSSILGPATKKATFIEVAFLFHLLFVFFNR